jgi:hypothetical protein
MKRKEETQQKPLYKVVLLDSQTLFSKLFSSLFIVYCMREKESFFLCARCGSIKFLPYKFISHAKKESTGWMNPLVMEWLRYECVCVGGLCESFRSFQRHDDDYVVRELGMIISSRASDVRGNL